VLRQNVGIARGFKPMSPPEMKACGNDAESIPVTAILELFKTTTKYDGRVGREQNGYPPPEELPI
jgi:hypothetical protein